MKIGTQGFVGGRLKEAREARGLSATALAEILGVTRAAVSQYETGKASPRPDVAEHIARSLNIPLTFFTRPVPERDEPAVFYRSMSTATKGARTKAERRFLWLVDEIVPFLDEFVELPKVNLPTVDLPADVLTLSDDQVEQFADKTRLFWNLGRGPISNVIWLLENHGVVIARGELEAEDLDSFCAWIDERPYMFLNADKQSAVRSRFDATHELGHLIMHRSLESRRVGRTAEHRIYEEQAHRFAAAFLLPADAFAADIFMPTLDALRSLKPKWKVSIGMMIKRAEHLDLIGPDQARRLWVAYARRGWKRGEPLDSELPIEEPYLPRSSVELLIREHVQDRQDILTRMPLAPSDIEALIGLPAGFLQEPPAPPPLKFPSSAGTQLWIDEEEAGKLVQFPRKGSGG